MKQEMFRKSALESLATPDRLDEAMRITRPRAWVALAAILLILVSSLIWSIFGTLPASVEGQGIIIREGGTFNVVSFGTGVVTELTDLNLGDPVHRGQVLGRIAQPEMEQQVAAQRKAVQQLIDEQNDLVSRTDALRPVQEKAVKLQQAVLVHTIATREEQLQSIRAILEGQRELLGDGLITRQRYEQTRQQALGAESDIDNARTMLQKLSVERIEMATARDNRLREVGNRL
ncbi:MAG: hypothetical protein ACJ8G3_26100, partial [Burkholderiaceae bacterium]